MAKGTVAGTGPQRARLRRVLLVDDNDRYAAAIREDLDRRGAEQVTRAVNAREGLELLASQPNAFDAVISDISMESQISGLKVLRAARKVDGLLVVCATTGLDTRIGYAVNYLLLGKLYRCDFLIPKRPIKRENRVDWVEVR